MQVQWCKHYCFSETLGTTQKVKLKILLYDCISFDVLALRVMPTVVLDLTDIYLCSLHE